MKEPKSRVRRDAALFLMFVGVIALFSDFVHEGARSIYGNYLNAIQVSAFVIALTAGLGECLGQALRSVTGVIADKTKKYWLMMFIGYAVNLLSIPLLYFIDASFWQIAIVLILLERVGKAIRAPAKSALVSFTTPHLGAGKAFALQEVLDQFGAVLGPIFVYFILQAKGGSVNGYQTAFGLLGIFAVVTLGLLLLARVKYPHPDQFEQKSVVSGFKGDPAFLLYMGAIVLIALGFIDFPLISVHLELEGSLSPTVLPLLYAFAMAIDAVAAIVFGILFDKIGVKSLMIAIAISAPFAPLVFLFDSSWVQIAGLVLWGIGMGAQESVLKSVIATLVPKDKRATAYGIFYAVFGISWFVGSTIIGAFYEGGAFTVIAIVSLVLEAAGVVLLGLFLQKSKKPAVETKTA